MFITLYRNFWTRYPSRSSKVSKDSDCSLVSNKNLNKILPSNGFSLGPGEVGQGGLKVLHLWHHSQEIHIPKPKNFFSRAGQDLPRLLSLWTALYHFRRPSYARAKPCVIQLFWRENPRFLPDIKVLKSTFIIFNVMSHTTRIQDVCMQNVFGLNLI